jgi:ring-1,2-phenylacetyl-CoA epoxidase subunit PaaE
MVFYPLTINDLRRETANCVSIAFQVPPQYRREFLFKAGQYLTLKTTMGGEEIRRSYSICSAPHEDELRVAVKEIEGGKFSTFANRTLKKGDILDVAPPMGHFTAKENRESQTHYAFFAAGSGITPIISIIKEVLQKDPLSSCTLIYGNRRVSSIIFKEDIEALKNKNLGRFQVFHVLSREKNDSDLLHGRLNTLKIKDFCEKILFREEKRATHNSQLITHNSTQFFSCGPLEMTEAVREVLTQQGVSEAQIHFELFNAPTSSARQKQVVQTAVASQAAITLDGFTTEIPIEKGQDILTAAQEAGLDVPFACKGGVCCTCRAKLTEGTVEMTVNYALTKAETDAGFILTCQALPKTEQVSVNFDLK